MFKDLPITIPESEWVVGSIKWGNNRTQPHPDYSTDHPSGLKGKRYIGKDPRIFPESLNDPNNWRDIGNPAGIDLADGAFYGLGSPGWVDWDFTKDLPMVKRVILTQGGKTIYDSQIYFN